MDLRLKYAQRKCYIPVISQGGERPNKPRSQLPALGKLICVNLGSFCRMLSTKPTTEYCYEDYREVTGRVSCKWWTVVILCFPSPPFP